MKTLVITLLVAAGAAGAWTWLRPATLAAEKSVLADATVLARRDVLRVTVSNGGFLKALNSLLIKPKFQRQGTIQWLVDEGKAVEAGDVLVEFEKTDIETQIADIESEVSKSQIELEAAQADLAIQARENQGTIDSSELTLKLAQLKLERHNFGDGPNQLRQKELDLEKARSTYKRLSEQFLMVPELAKEGFLTENQVEEERIALREAEIAQETAQKELELWNKYGAPVEVLQLENAVKDAERALVNAREKAEINLKERQVRVANTERQLKQAQDRLAKMKTELGLMTIKAEKPGIVHYGDPERPWMREEIKVGSVFRQGNTILTLPDLREMQVRLEVHEADIDKVKLDQKVDVTVETCKGRSFTGKVTKIASVATSNWGEGKTFSVEVTLDAAATELRAGVSAKAEILVDEIPDVVVVPVHAVVAEQGAHFCFVSEADGWKQRKVEIGKNNVHLVQVLEGLNGGERVLLYDPRGTSKAGGSESGDPGKPSSPPEQESGAMSPAVSSGSS
jgi:RND family efflux transporter MFP subunit